MSEVWLNPRFGWQCFKCWDGLIQRDQILQPIFPGEGTRKTPGPVTDTLDQGAGDLYVENSDTWSLFTVFDRADPTILYEFNFSVSPFAFPPTTDDTPPVSGFRLPNEWILYVQEGFLQFSQGSYFDQPFTANWEGSGSLYVDPDGFLVFEPYTQQLVTGI